MTRLSERLLSSWTAREGRAVISSTLPPLLRTNRKGARTVANNAYNLPAGKAGVVDLVPARVLKGRD